MHPGNYLVVNNNNSITSCQVLRSFGQGNVKVCIGKIARQGNVGQESLLNQ
jgi:hypothetical protein